jgi:S-adenosyl methyltransferase
VCRNALGSAHLIPDEADPAGSVARLREVVAPGSYLLISHADVSQAHAVGTERLSQTARELVDANQALVIVPARARDGSAGSSATGRWSSPA